MTTIVYSHPAFTEHRTGPGHPECPERLDSILAALGTEEFVGLGWREPPEATMEQLERVHPAAHIRAVFDAIPAEGLAFLDADTPVSPRSGAAALLAAGAGCAAVDAVMSGQARNAFCAVRPPGHHAERRRAMGACLFNNIGVAALHARAIHGCRRIAVVDFDVHHGNGTQDLFRDDANAFYGSTHQAGDGFFPETGLENDAGAAGTIVNRPLAAGDGAIQFHGAMRESILPALDSFRPDFVFISAGFDAHVLDRVANLRLTEADYAWATHEILDIAEKHCAGRVVSMLEGGYHLAALGSSVASHVAALMGRYNSFADMED